MSSDGKIKFTVIGIASILLVSAVIGPVAGVIKYHNSGDGDPDSGRSITPTNKAANTLCEHTDYKEACKHSLSTANNTSNPKQLMKMAFNSAIKELQAAIDKSSILKETAIDPQALNALDTCKELLNTSIDDLTRSIKKLDDFDLSNKEEHVEDLKVYLSGSITYEETCRDLFMNTSGDSGEKMEKLLELGGKLTSNALAMVNAIAGAGRDPPAGYDRRWWTRLVGSEWKRLEPNAIVAQDGSGMFRTIMDAVRTVPKKSKVPFVIVVKRGVYKEYVVIPRRVNNVVLMGEGPARTRITGDRNYVDGVHTYRSATVAVNGDGFIGKDLTIENTAGPLKHQAVALRVSGDKAILHNCAFHGYQDTLYAHSYRQFYRHCNISGTIDFVFGDAAAVFQDCTITVRKPLPGQTCMVTAQGRKDHHSKGGLILQGCTITADQDFLATVPMPKAYLGRPWKEFSRTIVMQSFIDRNIAPEGWAPWFGRFALDTCYYVEFDNRGPGSDTAQRVTWKGIKKISPLEAKRYTPAIYISGNTWIKVTGVPYDPGMMNV